MTGFWVRRACHGRRGERWALAGALALTIVFATMTMPGSASALSGHPIKLGSPGDINGLSEATDSSGTAYVAWADDETTPNDVRYCVVAAGASSCEHSGTLTPASSASNVDFVQVLVDGSTVVILADVYGASSTQYEPDQEWQSTNDGASFTAVDGGKSVADGQIDDDTAPLEGVIVPGTDELGLGFETPEDPPTFSAFALTSPPLCSESSCAANSFAELQPTVGVDEVSNLAGTFAAQSGSSPGVLGVFETLTSTGNLACPASDDFGTAFAYGSGTQATANNYNLDPGTTDSAWRVKASKLDCGVDYAAVAGGPSGFGVLEAKDSSSSTIYHRFDQTKEDFDTPTVTIVKQSEEQPALSQDAHGNVYATYLMGGEGGPVELSYSPNGGTNWTSAPIHPEPAGGVDYLTSDVDASGHGWASWIYNGDVYAQQFDARDAYAAAYTECSAPSSVTTTSRTKVKIPVTCPIACNVKLTLKKGATKLGSSHVSLSSAGKHTVTVTLTGAGARLFRNDHYKLTATISLETVDAFGTFTRSHRLKIRKR